MIQRIQSIYLLAASMLFFFLLTSPLAEIITENERILELNYLTIENADTSEPDILVTVWPLTALIAVVMVLGIINIFLYKKRTLQMRLCMFNILLMLGLAGMIYFFARFAPIGIERAGAVIGWPIVIPLISMILTYLALKAIQKDDALVKSYERLR